MLGLVLPYVTTYLYFTYSVRLVLPYVTTYLYFTYSVRLNSSSLLLKTRFVCIIIIFSNLTDMKLLQHVVISL